MEETIQGAAGGDPKERMTAGEDCCCCWRSRRRWDCLWAGVVDSCGCLWAGVVDSCGCLWAGVVEKSLGRVDCEAACCGWGWDGWVRVLGMVSSFLGRP